VKHRFNCDDPASS